MVDPQANGLNLDGQRIGHGTTCNVSARSGGKLLLAERLDLFKSKSRTAFAVQVSELLPEYSTADIEAELLKLADKANKAPTPATGDDAELDFSSVCRPELFHHAEVSGLAIPVMRRGPSGPMGQWRLYLRWHGTGKRECRDLAPCIELPDGGRLWLHPLPGPPGATQRPAWTARSRSEWLSDAPAPCPAGVFRRIQAAITYFLDFPPEAAPGTVATLALWTMLSYTFPAWSCVPYLSLGGPLGSGKSTVFGVLARMLFRPMQSSNMTAACLFRSLHDLGGCLLLDEGERLKDRTPDAAELRSILLSGYKAGSPAMRLEKVGDGFKRQEFNCFGPKALAAIASLPEALASRCIGLTMFRASSESKKPRRRLDADPDRWAGIRNDLHCLSLENGREWLALADRTDLVPADFNGREGELWQPLLALAGWLEGHGVPGLHLALQRKVGSRE